MENGTDITDKKAKCQADEHQIIKKNRLMGREER